MQGCKCLRSGETPFLLISIMLAYYPVIEALMDEAGLAMKNAQTASLCPYYFSSCIREA